MMHEKFYLLRVLALLVALFGVVGSVKAEYIDLTQGGVEKTPWMRCDEDRPQVCVIVEKDGVQYLVVHDQKGELKIYILKENTPVLIWSREMV